MILKTMILKTMILKTIILKPNDDNNAGDYNPDDTKAPTFSDLVPRIQPRSSAE